jgi:hypothetical protein
MLHAPNDDAGGDADGLGKGIYVGVGFQVRQFAGTVGRDQEVGGELVEPAILADYQKFFALPGIQMLSVTAAVWERAARIRATEKMPSPVGELEKDPRGKSTPSSLQDVWCW